MNQSSSIAKLADALTKAQAEMKPVPMNSVNPFLKNKYANLGDVIEASRSGLAKFGLSISQYPVSEGERIGVTSVLLHASGEWISETILLPASENKGLSVAQSAGVIISYLRRYSWASILGLYADEDTDANGAQPAKSQPAQPKPAAAAAQPETTNVLADKAVAFAAKAWGVDAQTAKRQIQIGIDNKVIQPAMTKEAFKAFVNGGK